MGRDVEVENAPARMRSRASGLRVGGGHCAGRLAWEAFGTFEARSRGDVRRIRVGRGGVTIKGLFVSGTLVPLEGEGTAFSIGSPGARPHEAIEFVAGVEEVGRRRDPRLRACFVIFSRDFDALKRAEWNI